MLLRGLPRQPVSEDYLMSIYAFLGRTSADQDLCDLSLVSALDLLHKQIRVNSVCPSWVDTPMTQASVQRNPKWGAIIQTLSPLKRAASPSEVAAYVCFLCSPNASYINGTGLAIDAGVTLGPAIG